MYTRALRELSSCEGMLLEYFRRVRKMYLKLPTISIEIFISVHMCVGDNLHWVKEFIFLYWQGFNM